MAISPMMNTVEITAGDKTFSFPYKSDIGFLTKGFLSAGGDIIDETLRFRIVKMLGDVVKFNSPMVVSNDPDKGNITLKLEYRR